MTSFTTLCSTIINSTFFRLTSKIFFNFLLYRDGVDDRYQTAEYTHASGSHEAQLANKNIMGGAMPASQAQEGLDLVDGQGTCFQKLKKRRRAVHHVYGKHCSYRHNDFLLVDFLFQCLVWSSHHFKPTSRSVYTTNIK